MRKEDNRPINIESEEVQIKNHFHETRLIVHLEGISSMTLEIET